MRIHFNNQRGASLMMTVVLLATMLTIAIGATSILIQGLRSSGISGRSTVAYLAAESGAERVLWYAVNDENFESYFSACSNGGYIDIHTAGSFQCAAYDHLIDPSNLDYFYRLRYTVSGDEHVFESVGTYYTNRRSVEITYIR